jgi:hypothetical protein
MVLLRPACPVVFDHLFGLFAGNPAKNFGKLSLTPFDGQYQDGGKDK